MKVFFPVFLSLLRFTCHCSISRRFLRRQAPDSLLSVCTIHHGQVPFSLWVLALWSPVAAVAVASLGRTLAAARLCDRPLRHSLQGLFDLCHLKHGETMKQFLVWKLCFGEAGFAPIDFPVQPGWLKGRARWEHVAPPMAASCSSAPCTGGFCKAVTTGRSQTGQHISSPKQCVHPRLRWILQGCHGFCFWFSNCPALIALSNLPSFVTYKYDQRFSYTSR